MFRGEVHSLQSFKIYSSQSLSGPSWRREERSKKKSTESRKRGWRNFTVNLYLLIFCEVSCMLLLLLLSSLALIIFALKLIKDIRTFRSFLLDFVVTLQICRKKYVECFAIFYLFVRRIVFEQIVLKVT